MKMSCDSLDTWSLARYGILDWKLFPQILMLLFLILLVSGVEKSEATGIHNHLHIVIFLPCLWKHIQSSLFSGVMKFHVRSLGLVDFYLLWTLSLCKLLVFFSYGKLHAFLWFFPFFLKPLLFRWLLSLVL